MLAASLLFRLLRLHGARYIFGIQGREAEVLSRCDLGGLRWILVRHEFSAAVAADAYGRLTGRPQVSFSTFGPGATNMATGIASARLDRAPLVALSAQVESKDRLHNQTHQCLDQLSVMRPLVKYGVELEHVRAMPETLRRAFRACISEPRGPSFLSLPIDLLRREISSRAASRILSRLRTLQESAERRPAIPKPDPKALGAALAIIRSGRCPVAIAGNEIIRDRAWHEFRTFCETRGVAAIESLACKGALPPDHPLNFGPVNRYLGGILGEDVLRRIFSPADVIILVGFDLCEDIRPEMWEVGLPKKVVRLGLTANPVPGAIRPHVEAVGSLKELLRLAAGPVSVDSKPRHPYLDRLRLLRGRAAESSLLETQPWAPARVVRVVRDLIGPAGILVADVGLHKQYAGLFDPSPRPGTFLASNGLGTFGFGLPAALGAQLAFPRRRVVAVVGDGGFHSGSQDLETLARYRLPIVIVVMADSSFGLIKHYQLRANRRAQLRTVDFLRVDFRKLAQANGCYGVKPRFLREFPQVLRRTLARREPAVIELPIRYRYRF